MKRVEKSYYSALVQRLSELMDVKPWLTLEMTDVFAVADPAGGDEMLFVQVRGGDGDEPFQLMAYRGLRGLELLWELNNSEEPAYVADMIADVSALFVTFVDSDELDAKDTEALEDMEGGFAGHGWPSFRSCRPGYQPGHMTEQELVLFCHVVRQTYEIVHQVNEEVLSLEAEEGQEDSYIVRKPVETAEGVTWVSERMSINLDDKLPKKYPKLKTQEMELLKELPLSERELRMDILLSPYVSEDEDELTPSTFLFTVTDYYTGDLLCSRIEEPGAKLQKFRESLLPTFQEVMLRLGERPKAVHVESYTLCDMLGGVIEKLGIELCHHVLVSQHTVEVDNRGGRSPSAVQVDPRQAELEAVLRHLGTRFTREPGKILF